nr:MAG TPA: hypothetical protein [Caudoviricetes sp.]
MPCCKPPFATWYHISNNKSTYTFSTIQSVIYC